MEIQTEIALPTGENAASRAEPRLWVKEFGVFKDFERDAEMRHVTLRAGLNIIWAKDSASGASGHAAGKSTFARMLRYLLGDVSYGSEVFRTSLRQKLPDACIAGEVHLNGVPWLIVRPLGRSGHHWACQGVTWNQLFDQKTDHHDYHLFTEAAAVSFIKPLASETFPGTDRKIEWGHLLQWLTRDQDARYAHLLEWRPFSGDGSELRAFGAGDKTNLVRMVLGMLTPEEQKLQTKHAELVAEQKNLDGEIPKLNYSRDRALAELKKFFPELAAKSVDYAMALATRKKEFEKKVRDLTDEFEKANQHDGVGDVLAATLAGESARKELLKGDLEDRADILKRLRLKLAHETGQLSQEEFRRQSAALGDIRGKCSNSLEMAHRFHCPIAPPILRDELQDARVEQARGASVSLADRIKALDDERASISNDYEMAVREETKAQRNVDSQRNQHAARRQQTFNELTGVQNVLGTISRALADQEDVHKKRERLKDLSTAINESSKNLAAWRKKATQQLSKLSTEFSKVASHLLRQKVDGKVQFNSDEIIPSLNYEGDLTSAALVTLRLLIFDLACLFGSAGPFPLHPGFLLHDSPREADLSASIYRCIFSLVAGEKENQSIQYVIATTEPPPEEQQRTPWLVCELSSSKPELRFLKMIV